MGYSRPETSSAKKVAAAWQAQLVTDFTYRAEAGPAPALDTHFATHDTFIILEALHRHSSDLVSTHKDARHLLRAAAVP